MDELIIKINQLTSLLKKNNKEAFLFFEKLSIELSSNITAKDALQKLITSRAISQYGDFNYEEDELFDSVLELANKENKRII